MLLEDCAGMIVSSDNQTVHAWSPAPTNRDRVVKPWKFWKNHEMHVIESSQVKVQVCELRIAFTINKST